MCSNVEFHLLIYWRPLVKYSLDCLGNKNKEEELASVTCDTRLYIILSTRLRNKIETKLKRNSFNNVSFLPQQNASAVKCFSCFSQSLSVYAVCLPNQRRRGAMMYVWRRRSQRCVVYCNALLFEVTTRVTRYILYMITPSVTNYFLPKLVTHTVSMFVD